MMSDASAFVARRFAESLIFRRAKKGERRNFIRPFPRYRRLNRQQLFEIFRNTGGFTRGKNQ
jgi:hypothetical protein